MNISGELRGVSIGGGSTIQDAVIIQNMGESGITTLKIGSNCKIGRRTILSSEGDACVNIYDNVSIHNNCVVIGSVEIKPFSILSANIFISSGNHYYRHVPHRLIMRQDKEVAELHLSSGVRSTVIDEDVWIGWGAVILNNAHIGRGAVVGAQSVVTRDVDPYAVVAGVPARRVGDRLKFLPRPEISSHNLEDWPYFYEGFLHLDPESEIILRGFRFRDFVSVILSQRLEYHFEFSCSTLLKAVDNIKSIKINGKDCSFAESKDISDVVSVCVPLQFLVIDRNGSNNAFMLSVIFHSSFDSGMYLKSVKGVGVVA